MEPINAELIANYGLKMSAPLAAALVLYMLRVATSHVATIDWLRANATRIGLGFVAAWALAAALVISPEISQLLGGLGFNADQSPAGMALVIAGIIIGATTVPKAGEEEGR